MAVDATLDDRVFSEAKRHCYAGHDEATLLREVADRLRSAVPFEGYCAHTVDPLSGLIANAIPEQVGGEKEVRLFLEHLSFANDVNKYNSMAKSRRPVALLSKATDGRLERSVQEHLCRAFDKVGVRDRQALAKRLFFDNIYPTLSG
jgi:hypothetical protein